MFKKLQEWFQPVASNQSDEESHVVAIASLLLMAADMDGSEGDAELQVIHGLLAREFPEQSSDVWLEKARKALQQRHDLVGFTKTLKDQFAPEERMQIMEMIWEVVLADGVVDPMEDMLVRKLAGLLYITDQERGVARQNVLERVNNEG